MFTGQESQTKANHVKRQGTLVTALTKLGTHPRILECIQHSLTTYEKMQYGQPINNHAPMYGSLLPLDVTVAQALQAQTLIRWELS